MMKLRKCEFIENFFLNDTNILFVAKEYNELLNSDNDSKIFRNRLYDIKTKLNIYIKGTLERLDYNKGKMMNSNYQAVMKNHTNSGFSLTQEVEKISEMKNYCDLILDRVKLGIALDEEDIKKLEYLCLYNKMQRIQLYNIMLVVGILSIVWILLN